MHLRDRPCVSLLSRADLVSSDLWMLFKTPPFAIVTLLRYLESSSSFRIASWSSRGRMRLRLLSRASVFHWHFFHFDFEPRNRAGGRSRALPPRGPRSRRARGSRRRGIRGRRPGTRARPRPPAARTWLRGSASELACWIARAESWKGFPGYGREDRARLPWLPLLDVFLMITSRAIRHPCALLGTRPS